MLRLLILYILVAVAESSCIHSLQAQIKHIKNGNYTIVHSTAGSLTVQFNCDIGYKLVGEARITCGQDSKWNMAAPSCQSVTCPERKLPEGTKVVFGHSHSYKAVHQYSCSKGYTFVAQHERVCQADGQWSAPAEICRRTIVLQEGGSSRWITWYMYLVYSLPGILVLLLVAVGACFCTRHHRRVVTLRSRSQANSFRMDKISYSPAATMSENNDIETRESVEKMDGQPSLAPLPRPAVLLLSSTPHGESPASCRGRDNISPKVRMKKRRKKRTFLKQLDDEVSNFFQSKGMRKGKYTTVVFCTHEAKHTASPLAVHNFAATDMLRYENSSVDDAMV